MPGATAVLALPYPTNADPVAVPADLQALATQIEAKRGAVNGLAGLDAGGKVPVAQLPSLGDLTRILDYVAGGPVASIDTNVLLGGAIPQTYKHLVAVWSGHVDVLGNYTMLQLNGDTAGNYNHGQNAYNGAARADSFVSGATSAAFAFNPGTGENALDFSAFVGWFPNYANTVARKTYHSVGHGRQQGANYNGMFGGQWASVAAISRIVFTVGSGGNFVANSRFTLYGAN